MKRLIIAIASLLSVTLCNDAANIRVVNYTNDLQRFLPIGYYHGALLPSNSGSVQIGYFKTHSDAGISQPMLPEIISDFEAFGSANRSGKLAQGAFDAEKSLPTVEGCPYIGKSICFIIRDGDTFEVSSGFTICKYNETFPQDNPASDALVDISDTNNVTWIVGGRILPVVISTMAYFLGNSQS